MPYISFDEFSEDTLHKEREACFNAGTSGEKLAQYITEAKEKHAKNAASLRHTVSMFQADEPKRRLHGKIAVRLEQEQKWVKHYVACAAEHTKGQLVFKIKLELLEAKNIAQRKAAEARAKYEQQLEETRKQCRIIYRAEYEAELKAKRAVKAGPKKKSWFGKLLGWISGNDWVEEVKAQAPKPAPMVAKQPVPVGINDNKKRDFYQLNPAERKARIEELRAKAAERAKAAAG